MWQFPNPIEGNCKNKYKGKDKKHPRRGSAQLLSEVDGFSTHITRDLVSDLVLSSQLLSSLLKLCIIMTIQMSFPLSISSVVITNKFQLRFPANFTREHT